MRQALEQLERLLRDYGHVYEANLAAIARATFERDPRAACREVNSEEWWNSTRSLAAIDFAVEGGFTAGSRQDARAYRAALSEVFNTMQANGEKNEAGELIVSQFHKWMESHI
jgi:hypothetical protein